MSLDLLRRRLPTLRGPRLCTYAGLTILLVGIGYNLWQSTPAAAAAVIPVRGVERLAWTQDAPSAAAAASYRFIALVDGRRAVLFDARCTGARNSTQYECEASLPPLSPGVHQIAVMTLDPDGYFTSPSELLELDVVPFPLPAARVDQTCLTGGSTNMCFAVDIVATGLAEVRNLKWLPDGRVLFVEDDADVRILDGDRISSAYAPGRGPSVEVRVADIAVAPDFSRSRH